MSYQGKNILFISAQFFQYEKAIVKALENLGAQVDYFDERPSNSVWTKGMIRVNPQLQQRKIDQYYQEIQSEIQHKTYDYFILIKGESIPIHFLKKFNEQNPDTKTRLYLYDTIKEYPKFKELFPFFDRCITFEPQDAIKYSLDFQPLFYLENYNKSPKKSTFLYDLVFIGTAHSDRFSMGEKIKTAAEKLQLRTYFYYYSPSKMVYYLKRIFDPHFKKIPIRKLNFNPLNHQDIIDIYQNSKAVIDINKPFQFGLSMRTFETLMAGNKLVTTNPEIRFYPFYSPENIAIIDRNKIDFSLDFFKTDFQNLSKIDLDMLSLKHWAKALLGDKKENYWVSVLEKIKAESATSQSDQSAQNILHLTDDKRCKR